MLNGVGLLRSDRERDVAKRMVLSLRDNPLGSFLGPLSRLCAGRLPPHEDVTILNFDLDPLPPSLNPVVSATSAGT